MGLLVLVFGLLNTKSVQNYAKGIIVSELQARIGSDLGIKHLTFQPFNSIQLDSLYLNDESKERVLIAEKVIASIDLFALMGRKIVITNAHLSDFEIHLSKEQTGAPINIQYIIDAFKSDEKQSASTVNIQLNTIYLANGTFAYDIKDKEHKLKGFDANHIAVSNLNAKLSLKSLLHDSLNIQIKHISLKEKSGLEISNFICRLITHNNKASLKGFRLDLPASYLELDRCEIDLSNKPDSVSNSVLDYALLDCIISPSYIAPKDISAFTSTLQYFNDLLTLKGHIYGTLDDLKAENLSLNLGDKIHLVTSAEIKDVRDTKKMYILGKVNKLILTHEGIEGLADNFSQNKNQLPAEIAHLGTISFQGDISGYLERLSAFGSLDTQLGTVNADILFGFNPSHGLKSYLRGKIYTTKFDLEGLTANQDFKDLSLNLSVDITRSDQGKLKGKLIGSIHDFSYRNYEYKDISFDANYDGLRIDSKLIVNTTNGTLDINGFWDRTNRNFSELDVFVHAQNVELDDLQLATKFHDSNLSFDMHANIKGNNIDDALGYIEIDTMDFSRENQFYRLNHFLLNIEKDSASTNKLSLVSDVINGEMRGVYSFSAIAKNIQQSIQPYLSKLIDQPQTTQGKGKRNNIEFNFQIENTEALSNIFSLPITVFSPAQIVGKYNNIDNDLKLEILAPNVKIAGKNIKSGYALIELLDDHIDSQIKASIVSNDNQTNELSVLSTIADNRINTHISFLNDGSKKTKGEFFVDTRFSRQNKDALQIDLDILPSELLLNKALWQMDKSHILILKESLSIDNFSLYTKDRSQDVKINGRLSKNDPHSVLKAELKSIDLQYVFETLAIDALKFSGKTTGDLYVSTIEGKPYANTNLEVVDFGFNNTELGTMKLFSELDKETLHVILDGSIVSKENKTTTVNGFIDPVGEGLSLHFDADSIDIGFLSLYTASVLDHVSGRGSGNVHLFGDFSNVTVEGDAYVEKGNIGLPFLSTDYSFSDSIYLKRDLIYFNDIAFTDKHGNRALGSGKVSHDYFTDFAYNIELMADRFLVYNATAADNPLFYGNVFASGKGSIGGNESEVNIDISMRTEANTSVRMNFMQDEVHEYKFITYKDEAKPNKTGIEKISLAPIPMKTSMAINMNFYIDATPDAEVEIVMDPIGGDILSAIGSGTIQFLWNTKDAPRLYGTYNINRGSYNFTFQRLMERTFSIADGSSVHFKGDPFEATLNVEALYKVIANLNDLDRDLAKFSGQTSIPVNCILNLAGPLKQPSVRLDLAFPRADPEVERQLKSLVNTEDMINRQVTYLLLLSKFYTPSYAITEHRTSDFAAVASATLSNQLTKIVSQIDKRWQLGTNIRTSDADFTSTEVELILSSQLLNNRLLINGNFGYRDDPSIEANNAFIGDIDLELLLNNSGSWRIKAYNHYNEKYYYNLSAPQTQGLGIMYKKSFDKLSELFFWSKPRQNLLQMKNNKKLDEPKLKDNELNSFVKIKK